MEKEGQEVVSLPVIGVEVGEVSNGANFKGEPMKKVRLYICPKGRELVKDLLCRYHPFEK